MSIADSSSVYTEERVLPQHQAALTIIQGMVADPDLEGFGWLDLACGRGQIIAHLDSNLSANARSKISYFGYDINQEAIRHAQLKAESLGFRSQDFQIGAIDRFSRDYADDSRFDFISLTNTVHEIVRPKDLARTLFDGVARLSQRGCYFIYDMETLPTMELGAIPWKKTEAEEIVQTFLQAVEAANYEPGFGQWKHRNVSGWNVQLQRRYIRFSDAELRAREPEISAATEAKIRDLLERKFDSCKRLLNSLTRNGAETQQELEEKEMLLYDFWALHCALEEE